MLKSKLFFIFRILCYYQPLHLSTKNQIKLLFNPPDPLPNKNVPKKTSNERDLSTIATTTTLKEDESRNIFSSSRATSPKKNEKCQCDVKSNFFQFRSIQQNRKTEEMMTKQFFNIDETQFFIIVRWRKEKKRVGE